MAFFTVLYFGSASTFTQTTSDTLEAPLLACRLPSVLEARYPGFGAAVLTSCAFTHNLAYIDIQRTDGGLLILAGDEVGVLPPGGGG